MRIPLRLLRHTVSVTPYLGDSAYGPIYGDTVDLQTRIEFSTGVTKNGEGQDITYNARLFLLPEADLAPEAKLEYIDQMGRKYQLTVITIAPMHDVAGELSHIEVEAKYG